MLRKSSIFWGGVLILLGGLFLIDSLGILEINLWGIFGPLLLILFGVWVLAGYFIKEGPVETENLIIPIKNARRAKIVLQHGAGHLKVGADTDPMTLLSGTFSGGVGQTVSEEGDSVDVRLRFRDAVFPIVVFPWFLGPGKPIAWDVNLTNAIPIDLTLKIGANEAQVNLSRLQVTNLRVETGVSSTEIFLPEDVDTLKAKVNAGVASVTIHVPEKLAAKIYFSGGLMDFRVDRTRFPKTGAYYQSPDFETSPQKVELRIEGGVGSVNIQ